MHAIRLSIILGLISTLIIAEPNSGSIGTVLNTKDGGSYTYIQSDFDGEMAGNAYFATLL